MQFGLGIVVDCL